MYWVDGSPEQSVPQTPPIFHEFVYNSTSSPCATVPEQEDVHSSQESQGKFANVCYFKFSYPKKRNNKSLSHNVCHIVLYEDFLFFKMMIKI